MEETPSFYFEWVEGAPPRINRAIAWLMARPALEEVNGKAEFERLPERREQLFFLDYMNEWLDHKRRDRHFHGWGLEGSYKNVFQFMYDPTKRKRYRLMGFICTPYPRQ